jgi:hypothetical protein
MSVYYVGGRTQTSSVTVTVLDYPLGGDSDLRFDPGSITNNMRNGGSLPIVDGTNLILDAVLPRMLWHGGYKTLNSEQLKFYGDGKELLLSNSLVEVQSGERNRGLFELKASVASLTEEWDEVTSGAVSVTDGEVTVLVINGGVDVNFSSIYFPGDWVEIGSGVGYYGWLPPGNYQVESVNDTGTIAIRYNSYGQSTVGGMNRPIRKVEYVWDEIYCTPVGLYQVLSPVGPPVVGYYEMYVNGVGNVDLTFAIEDSEQIIPKVGDTIVLKRFASNLESYSNQSGTDEINNMNLIRNTESFKYQIENVLWVTDGTRKIYTIRVDKTITFTETVEGSGVLEKYFLVLLNREGVETNKELLPETFKLTEIHRSQILGDPFEEIDPSNFLGRTNHYNYSNAGRLGLQWQFKNLLVDKQTPFILLEIGDKIKDRISVDTDSFKVHIPNIMLQGETTSCILFNADEYSAGMVDTDIDFDLSAYLSVKEDIEGVGRYGGLYLKHGKDKTKRYGWVLYDWRCVLIDDSELVTAMMYNSNRNYTLPSPSLPINGNNKKNWTAANPLSIINIQPRLGLAAVVTTGVAHGFTSGMRVYISDVVGPFVNSDIQGSIYVDVLSSVTFQIYSDALLNVPIDVSGNPSYQLSGLVYRNVIDYEYFLTYRITGYGIETLPYSEVIPFNFQSNNLVNNSSGDVTFFVDQFTHLSEYDPLSTPELLTRSGFSGERFEVIIGKYKTDSIDPLKIIGVEEVVVMPDVAYVFGQVNNNDLRVGGVQIDYHQVVYTKSVYDGRVSAGLNDYILTDNSLTTLPNTLPNNTNYPIYGLPVLPQDLFTGRNKWFEGNVIYKEDVSKYRLSFELKVSADKWNTTTNPSYDITQDLINSVLISELAFLIADESKAEGIDPTPYVYAKISPPIQKSNQSDITIKVHIDF